MPLFPLLPIFHASLKGSGFFPAQLYAVSVSFSVLWMFSKKKKRTTKKSNEQTKHKDFFKISHWWNIWVVVFFYLLDNILCSIIIVLHTVNISNVLPLTVDYNSCLILVSVLMLIHCVLDVRLFPQGGKSYVLLSLTHSCVYT